eukprot:Gb_38655 [translate_table: standard]
MTLVVKVGMASAQLGHGMIAFDGPTDELAMGPKEAWTPMSPMSLGSRSTSTLEGMSGMLNASSSTSTFPFFFLNYISLVFELLRLSVVTTLVTRHGIKDEHGLAFGNLFVQNGLIEAGDVEELQEEGHVVRWKKNEALLLARHHEAQHRQWLPVSQPCECHLCHWLPLRHYHSRHVGGLNGYHVHCVAIPLLSHLLLYHVFHTHTCSRVIFHPLCVPHMTLHPLPVEI